ncbi:hypothetical protein JCM14635_16810 [Megalodesulfovibrio paquesii]
MTGSRAASPVPAGLDWSAVLDRLAVLDLPASPPALPASAYATPQAIAARQARAARHSRRRIPWRNITTFGEGGDIIVKKYAQRLHPSITGRGQEIAQKTPASVVEAGV